MTYQSHINSQLADTRAGQPARLKRFVANRLKESGYGAIFCGVFLMCHAPLHALAIDDIRVLSRLGQPLMAEVVLTPAAGEALHRGCFTTGRANGDLPGVGPVRLTLSRNLNTRVLGITGVRPMREPLTELVLQVKCPGVPTMFKSFLVMVDPPALNEGTAVTAAATAATAGDTAAAPAAVDQRRSARAPSTRRAPAATIAPGSRYTVRSGDMLSTIASRVAGRPDWSVWPIAQQIYASNPGAFLLGNPNVIAEGATIYIPRLDQIDLSATLGAPQAAPSSTPASARTRPAPPGNTIPAVTPAPTPVASAPAAVLPQRRVIPAAAAPLPTMQLTAALFDESRIKVQLRAQGVPVAPAVMPAAQPAPVAPAAPPTEPSSQPERPDAALADSRVALPAAPAQTSSWLNWLLVAFGLIAALLMGAFGGIAVMRRRMRQQYSEDLHEAVSRQARIDELRHDEPVARPEPARDIAARKPARKTPERAAPTRTVEIGALGGLDLELPQQEELASVGEPETLDMPGISEDLDLELPDTSGRTGQHEVDFDLLERAYSEDYQSEFVDKPATPGQTADPEVADEDTRRYYHLENRDPADDTPLSIELGEDEMVEDPEENNKVVRFPG